VETQSPVHINETRKTCLHIINKVSLLYSAPYWMTEEAE